MLHDWQSVCLAAGLFTSFPRVKPDVHFDNHALVACGFIMISGMMLTLHVAYSKCVLVTKVLSSHTLAYILTEAKK